MCPAKVESANFEQILNVNDSSVSFEGYPGFSVEVLENSGDESETIRVENYHHVGVSGGDDSNVSTRYDFFNILKKVTFIDAGYADFMREGSDKVRVSLVDEDLNLVKVSNLKTAQR